MNNEKNGIVSFQAPEVNKPKTAHFIVEVTDDGEPMLTRYERVIVTIMPWSNDNRNNPLYENTFNKKIVLD